MAAAWLPCPACPAAVKFTGDLPMLPHGLMHRCPTCGAWMLVAYLPRRAVMIQAFQVNMHERPIPVASA